MEIQREQLVEAFHKWNKEYFEDKDGFSDIDDTVECAESQADKLIELLGQ